MAEVMGTESAIVRPHFVSGTHAIAAALYGALRPGDMLFLGHSDLSQLALGASVPPAWRPLALLALLG